MKQSCRLVCLLFLIFFSPKMQKLYAYAKPDSIVAVRDSTINYRFAESRVFESKHLVNLPHIEFIDYQLQAPGAYEIENNEYFSIGFRQSSSNLYIDGMQLLDGWDFPKKALIKLTISTYDHPIELGFAGHSIFEGKTNSFLDEFEIMVDINNDRSYDMSGYEAELVINKPLWKINREHSKSINLFIAARIVYQNKPYPVWKETARASDSFLSEVSDEPFVSDDSFYFYRSADIDENGVVTGYGFTNHPNKGIYPYFKLEIPFTDEAQLNISNYSVFEEQRKYLHENAMFNGNNDPLQQKKNNDTYLEWNHSFKVEGKQLDYKLFGQYSAHKSVISSNVHKDNFFDYGYLGQFITYRTPIFELGLYDFQAVWEQVGFSDTLLLFNPMGSNPNLSAYTSQLFSSGQNFRNTTELAIAGGLLNGNNPKMVYDLFNSLGSVHNYYQESEMQKFRAGANLGFNVGRHYLKAGFEYNHETDRYYQLEPARLWPFMRGLSNRHLLLMDHSNPTFIYNPEGSIDTVMYPVFYDAELQSDFDKNLRQALGLLPDGSDFILIDSYNPHTNQILYYDEEGILRTLSTPDNLLSLSLFSARELQGYGNQVAQYAGYNYLGNKSKSNDNPYSYFEDFSVGPEREEYWAFYLEDSFNWNKLKAKLGFRVDIYDANRPVLIDPYSLVETFTAGEVDISLFEGYTKPSNIGDDYVVYVNRNNDPTRIMGYRNDNKWYLASGAETEYPDILDAGSGVQPYMKYPDIRIGDPGWNPGNVFTVYRPVVNFLPQLHFDYTFNEKISGEFKYSSYTVNPDNNKYRPDVFLFPYAQQFETIRNNTDLKPTRIEQLITGVNFSLHQKLRAGIYYQYQAVNNAIAPMLFLEAYPSSYFMLVNSSKYSTNGLTFNMAFINRSEAGLNGNIELVKLFTNKNELRFFETSDAVFNGNISYSFGGQAFSNTGKFLNSALSNVTLATFFQYRKGLPFRLIETFGPGVIAYQPYFRRLDFQIRKSLPLKDDYLMSFYITAENLFNFKNVYQVYSSTGLADDDGFLDAPVNQRYINSMYNPEAFRLLYKQYLNNPAHFSNARIVRLGVCLSF
jgi:hypothetical protein